MGCGESKHAISTADTISQSKRSSSDVNKNVKDVVVEQPTNDVKIPEKDENKNADIIAKLENVGNDFDHEAVQSSAETNVKGKGYEIKVDDDGKKKDEAENPKKTEDVVDVEPVKEEKEVEKVKEDEIKEVKIAAVDDEEKEDAAKKADSDVKIEEAPKENEINQIKEEEPEKSAEAKGSTEVAEPKIPSVEEKVDDSADKDIKST